MVEHYVDGCPGCRVDKRKAQQKGTPFKQLFIIWMIVLSSGLSAQSLYPFLYFMVGGFKIVRNKEDIGFYAGFIGASFLLGRALTSIFWGVIADKYGRKPVLIIGCTAVVVFNTLFGISTEFWMAVTTRFLLGSLNGVLGPIKAYACEVVRDEHQTLGLSAVSTAWGTALILGPAIGGFLAQPAEKYPGTFAADSLFGRFPFFLPCLVISLFVAVVTVTCFWIPLISLNRVRFHLMAQEMQETLHTHARLVDDLESAGTQSPIANRSGMALLKNWTVMSSVIVYSVFSLHDTGYIEIFSLWTESPITLGGLKYSSAEVGKVLMVSGVGLLVFQSALYPIVERITGPILLSRILGVLSVPLLTSYHYIAMLSGRSESIVLTIASLLKNVFSISILTGLIILQNNAVDQEQRGAANGISVTVMSLFKAVGPAGAGALFSWCQKRQTAKFLPGDLMLFFLLNMVEVIGVIMTFKPFLVERRKVPNAEERLVDHSDS